MIPKIIHYCWFGKSDLPPKLKKCIDSWKEILPDYQIIRWDETNFDVNAVIWTKEAYERKKFAFVSDYARLKALYENGGIYFDTDVFVVKSFDEFLNHKAFTGFEDGTVLTSSVMAAERKFPLIKEFLDYYKDRHFLDAKGNENKIANVVMITDICKKYGLTQDNTYQEINEMVIYPRTYFCPYDFYMNRDFSDKTHSIHYFEGSWLDNDARKDMKYYRSPLIKLKYKIMLLISDLIKGNK